MRPDDTTRAAHELQLELYRKAGPERRVQIAAELSDTVRELAREGIRRRHPEFDEHRVSQELLRILYDVREPRP
jgi:hypothetical protein